MRNWTFSSFITKLGTSWVHAVDLEFELNLGAILKPFGRDNARQDFPDFD